jgi:hypothetical protein
MGLKEVDRDPGGRKRKRNRIATYAEGWDIGQW